MRAPSKRECALLVVASIVILAAALSYSGDGDGEGAMLVAQAAPIVKPKSEPHRVAEVRDLDLSQLRRESSVGEPGNLFVGRSWYVAPPPPRAKPLPPPPPSAPALPFTYLGRYQDRAKPVIFLMRDDRVLLVSGGDVIEGTYRVDDVIGTALGLTYLPLNIRQTLDIGYAE